MRVQTASVELLVDSLSHDGRGVGRHEGKAVFVDGALPGERIVARLTQRKRQFDIAALETILLASADRMEPPCPHFAQCGGCSLQHLRIEAQIDSKQQVLAENLLRIGKVTPQQWLPPLQGEVWGYRRKARLGVRYVRKKGRLLVGFREKATPYITDTQTCRVLHPSVGEHVQLLADTIQRMSIREQVPQIEVAIGDESVVLVIRVLQPLPEQDRPHLLELGRRLQASILIQPGGPDSIYPLENAAEPLFYLLPDWGIRIDFEPQDFTQVNQSINRQMIAQALHYLQAGADDVVLDLFCGLGNFSLPLARQAGRVIGVEGDDAMVVRARRNAERNGIGNCEFFSADLFNNPAAMEFLNSRFSKVLLDPPRSGAEAVARWLCQRQPQTIVYVSCNPATLARDAGVLVHEGGYRLCQAGAMDMFPHTAHTEAMAVFERG